MVLTRGHGSLGVYGTLFWLGSPIAIGTLHVDGLQMAANSYMTDTPFDGQTVHIITQPLLVLSSRMDSSLTLVLSDLLARPTSMELSWQKWLALLEWYSLPN